MTAERLTDETIREERAWAESRGRNVSNSTMHQKNLRGAAFLQRTIPQSAGINSDQTIYSRTAWQCSPMPCRQIRLYPSITARKPIALPPRNFPPRHQVSSRAQNMPNVPEQRTCQLKRKFAATKGGGSAFTKYERIVVRCRMSLNP
ncbi:hypothetical protein PAMP_001920 [Pampus punctatissimus]